MRNTLETTLKNARDEAFLSLLYDIRDFHKHRDIDRIKEWTEIQSYLSAKHCYYILKGQIKPKVEKIFRDAYEKNYQDPNSGGW